MELTAINVESVLVNCLFNEGENSVNHVKGTGIMLTTELHPFRLESNKDNIVSMLSQLPDASEGLPFQELCMTKEGSQWGEHYYIDLLVNLGSAINKLSLDKSRNMFGLPYVVIKI